MVPDVLNASAGVDASAKSKALDAKSKLKLQKAVQDFEALFVNYMLQNMRKTVQKSDEETSDFGGDMMQGMFDLEIAKHVTRKSNLGIGEMLYRQLTGEALPKAGPADADRPIKIPGSVPIEIPKSAPINIPGSGPIEIPRNAPIKIPVSASVSVPISAPDQVKVSPPARDTTSTKKPNKLDQFQNIIQDASGKYDVDPNLIKAVIAAESAGNPRAISPKSAKGLMQLIDSTATAMGVKDVWNPQQNINGGAKYLKQLLDRFNGDTTLAVASYNAGPKAVEKHQGIPPYTETKQYVIRVLNYLRLFEQKGSAE